MTADGLLTTGERSFQRGDVPGAVASWREARRLYAAAGQRDGQAAALADLAAADQYTGDYAAAAASLGDALKLVDAKVDLSRYVALKSAQGAVATFRRRFTEAESDLNEALKLARETQDPRAEAGVQNNLGILYSARSGVAEATAQTPVDDPEEYLKRAKADLQSAADAFGASRDLASRAGNGLLAAKARANGALALERLAELLKPEADRSRSFPEADRAWEANGQALAEATALPDSRQKAYLLVTIGKTDTQLIALAGALREKTASRAHQAFQAADAVARRLDDPLARSFALGSEGHLDEVLGNRDQALALTRQAAFWAQRAQDPNSLFRWQWQTGRLLRDSGRTDDAIASYTAAAGTLQAVRSDIALGYGNGDTRVTFRKGVGSLYFELADLLIRRAQQSGRGDDGRRQDLLAARETVERLKTGELEDYFQDPCVNQLRTKVRDIDAAVPAATAIFYIIPLKDRTALLLDFPASQPSSAGGKPIPGQGLKLWTVDVPEAKLASTVQDFRNALEDRTSYGFTAQGKQLYDWLIAPVLPELESRGIDTLVFVPDGSLRGVPMAALWDGQKFLVQRYALAVTPGLTLMEPEPIRRENIHLLLNGLSESRQGYPGLPRVKSELADVQRAVSGSGTELLDKDFVVRRVQSEISDARRPYSIVHIASHGEFHGNSKDTFLLTWDNRLTLDQLQSLIAPTQYTEGHQVDLLTLSACQTAAGDDRAALGLAGVAIRAGARSALASLWSVQDDASAALIAEFYRQLVSNPGITKAKALQNAQRMLLESPRYQAFRHPIYWAPFMVIGNWL